MPFIAMQYVEGRTLGAMIRSEGGRRDGSDVTEPGAVSSKTNDRSPNTGSASRASRAELVQVCSLIEQVARALHAAHEAGVVHRDIKPGNIMVTPDGRPVILDFGLARDDDADVMALTKSGDQLGTPGYMSPEQVRETPEGLDGRSDVYSLGVTLFEALTRQPLFEGLDGEPLMRAILEREPPSARRLNPAISRDLSTILGCAMAKERAHRYPTALALAEDLARLRRHEPVVARRAGTWIRFSHWFQRRPALAVSVCTGFIGLVVSLAISLSSWQEAEARRKDADAKSGLASRASERAARMLGESRRRSDEAQLAERAMSKQLGEWTRLADARRLELLIAEADGPLWPSRPEQIAAIESWLNVAREVVGRKAEHEEALRALRKSAQPYSDEARKRDRDGRALEALRLELQREQLDGIITRLARTEDQLRPNERESLEQQRQSLSEGLAASEALLEIRETWEFRTTEERFRHDELARYVAASRRFANPAPGDPGIDPMTERLAFVETIESRSIHDQRELWERTIDDVAAWPIYRGLKLAPQLGLIPLGRDPHSGLAEFAHLQTGEPARRDPVTQELRIDVETGIVLVLIPGGEFRMGRDPDDVKDPHELVDDELHAHQVVLTAFLISKYEMTQAQWRRAVGKNPSSFHDGSIEGGVPVSALHPAERMSWPEARETMRRLDLCLPTEAQWEFAARGGTKVRWWTGDEPADLRGKANFADLSLVRYFSGAQPSWPDFDDGWPVHAPVGRFAGNPFGLHDTMGNVSEWCEDGELDYRQPMEPGSGLRQGISPARSLRGGNFTSHPDDLRSGRRNSANPGYRDSFLGLRPSRRLED